MLTLQILGILVFSLLLIKGSDWAVVAIRRLSRSFGISTFAISAIIIALGTSFPELFVGIAAGLEGKPNLSLGNVVGSNIANVALISGLVAVFFGRINGYGIYLKREIFIASLAGLAPLFLLLDGSLSRVDALILLALYGLYASSLFKKQYEEVAKVEEGEGFWHRITRKIYDGKEQLVNKEMGRLFLGLALLLFSADMIVKIATPLAQGLGVPLLLIGIFLVAIGTSLPELAFSFKTVGDHEPQMFFGNILGSTIANSTLIIGITALLSPIKVVAINDYTLSIIVFIIIYLLFWFFVGTKRHLTRLEGGLLIFIYILFIFLEFSGNKLF